MCSYKPGRRNLSVARLKEELRGVVDLELSGWEMLGDVMVLKLPEHYPEDVKRAIGERILELHPKAVSVVNRCCILDELREPRAEVIAGVKTETVYAENGCRFKLDPTKVMFSFGNKGERERMARVTSPGEVVVDMFACVGQFAIPIARHSRPRQVIAIEKNPVAFRYLEENVRLNRLSNIEPVLGDCRELAPPEVADRVIMGYIFKPERFIETAVSVIREKGVVHYHTLSTIEELADVEGRALERFARAAGEAWMERVVKVKSYSPHRYHFVFDIKVVKG